MSDKEILVIAKATIKILEDADLGLDNAINVIKVLCIRVEELNEELNNAI